MRSILAAILIAFSGSATADPLTKSQIYHVCEYLLATPTADLHGPQDPRALETVLRELFSIKDLGSTSAQPLPLHNLRVRRFVRDWARLLESHKDPQVRALGQGLIKWELNPVSRTVVIGNDVPDALAEHARAHIENELDKLPPHLLNTSTLLGRTLFITFGTITQSPLMAVYKGVVPRGWNLAWDAIPGAGGGREGAVVDVERLVAGPNSHHCANLTLHEVLHNIDHACGDVTGKALSEQPGFLRRWRETDFKPEDDYMKSYPEETFAEFGGWFYHSPQSREQLRDLYPQWYAYFQQLSCLSRI